MFPTSPAVPVSWLLQQQQQSQPIQMTFAAAAAAKEEIDKAPSCFVEVTIGAKTKFVTAKWKVIDELTHNKYKEIAANPAFDVAFCSRMSFT
jgi:hypothetical protein